MENQPITAVGSVLARYHELNANINSYGLSVGGSWNRANIAGLIVFADEPFVSRDYTVGSSITIIMISIALLIQIC